MKNRLALFLLSGTALLLFLVALTPFLADLWAEDPVQMAETAAPTEQVPTPNIPASPVLSPQDEMAAAVATILARPLFNATRKPDATARTGGDTPNAEGGTEDNPLPRLAGIIRTGTVRRAIFQAGGDEKPVILSEGGLIQGYNIQEITAKTVIINGPGGELVLQVKPDPNGPGQNGAQDPESQPAPGFTPPPPGAVLGTPAAPGYIPGIPGQPPQPSLPAINGRQLNSGGEAFNVVPVVPRPASIGINPGQPGGINPTVRLPPAPTGNPAQTPRLRRPIGRQQPGAIR